VYAAHTEMGPDTSAHMVATAVASTHEAQSCTSLACTSFKYTTLTTNLIIMAFTIEGTAASRAQHPMTHTRAGVEQHPDRRAESGGRVQHPKPSRLKAGTHATRATHPNPVSHTTHHQRKPNSNQHEAIHQRRHIPQGRDSPLSSVLPPMSTTPHQNTATTSTSSKFH
jgi:hypothetical protein